MIGIVRRSFLSMVVALLFAGALQASGVRLDSGPFDGKIYVDPSLRLIHTYVEEGGWDVPPANIGAIHQMLAQLGPSWKATYEEETDRAVLLEGGAVPWIPGAANSLGWQDWGGCRDISCIPAADVEQMALEFLATHADAVNLGDFSLAADTNGCGSRGGYMYLLRFGLSRNGLPVDGASVFFRINNGNLIQMAFDMIGAHAQDETRTLEPEDALDVLYAYLEEQPTPSDNFIKIPYLKWIPVMAAVAGQQVQTYALVYEMVFVRDGVMGTWLCDVDARTGQVLRFVDSNAYGHIQGGVYKTDAPQTEVKAPFPFADYIERTQYSNIAGDFPVDDGISTMTGRIGSTEIGVGGVDIIDECGDIYLEDTNGLIDFDMSTGTDCDTPGDDPPPYGGLGNTHAARTQYWNLTQIKIKAYTYWPGGQPGTWLQEQLNANVNIQCDQGWCCQSLWGGNGTVNFYRSGDDPPNVCRNTGELPSLSFHEWGHGMDNNDGAGGYAGHSHPEEAYADWTAILQLRDSCVASGLWDDGKCLPSNPPGYGDACLYCTGFRDADWFKHAHKKPWTAANLGENWSCSGTGERGPCAEEDHCESGIATQALWDMVKGPTPPPEPQGDFYLECGLDLASGWQLADRLWYVGISTLVNMYTCDPPDSNGCGPSSIYTVMRAVDDDGDGTANGTPHAAAIFSALDRHNIACGWASDPWNQNQTSCPTLAAPMDTEIIGGNKSADIHWGTVVNATAYQIFRNEVNCDTGFTKVGEVVAPGTMFHDMPLANKNTYYYQVQAYNGSPSCAGPVSECKDMTPDDCASSMWLDRPMYDCDDMVGITLTDSGLNMDPETTEDTTVDVFSATEPIPEVVTLTETGPDTGEFTGTIQTGISTSPDGIIGVIHGDAVTVRYLDAESCDEQQNVTLDATAPIDCQPPVISNVHVTDITPVRSVVMWTTDEPATTIVYYGLSTPPAFIAQSPYLVTNHAITLTDLSPCHRITSPYYFKVISDDAAGNSTTDDNGEQYYTFETPAVAITSVSPIVVPANISLTIIIYGINFAADPDMLLKLDGELTSFQYISNTEIRVTRSFASGIHHLRVSRNFGDCTTNDWYPWDGYFVSVISDELFATPTEGTTAGGALVDVYAYPGLFNHRLSAEFYLDNSCVGENPVPAESVKYIDPQHIQLVTPRAIEHAAAIRIINPNESTVCTESLYTFKSLAFTANQGTGTSTVVDTYDNVKFKFLPSMGMGSGFAPVGLSYNMAYPPARVLYALDKASGDMSYYDAANFVKLGDLVLQDPGAPPPSGTFTAFDMALFSGGERAFVAHVTAGLNDDPTNPTPGGLTFLGIDVYNLGTNYPYIIDVDDDPQTTSPGAPSGITRAKLCVEGDCGTGNNEHFYPLSVKVVNLSTDVPNYVFQEGEPYPGEYAFVSGLGYKASGDRPAMVAVLDLNRYLYCDPALHRPNYCMQLDRFNCWAPENYCNPRFWETLQWDLGYADYKTLAPAGCHDDPLILGDTKHAMDFAAYSGTPSLAPTLYLANQHENLAYLFKYDTNLWDWDTVLSGGNPFTIPTGDQPTGIKVQFVDPYTYAYITNADDDTVTVIDTYDNLPEVSPDPLLKPSSYGTTFPMSYDTRSTGNYGYSANYVDGTVSVFDLATHTYSTMIDVGDSPADIVVQPVPDTSEIFEQMMGMMIFSAPADYTIPEDQDEMIGNWKAIHHLVLSPASPQAIKAAIDAFLNKIDQRVTKDKLKKHLKQGVGLYRVAYVHEHPEN